MSFVFSASAAKIANVPLSCFAPEGPTDNSKAFSVDYKL